MNIVVALKQVPDLVEELEVDASGKDLNREWLKYKINEFDDHALEEALLLKEEHGATVTAIALESPDIEKTLFTAAAKGADRVMKVKGDFPAGVAAHVAARALANALQSLQFDLLLTGVQAADDRDGQIGALLAAYLGLPQVSVVTGVEIQSGKALVHKEYSGGVMAEFEVDLPAVLGIQAARQTPRYAPVSRVRQAMRSTTLEEMDSGAVDAAAGSTVSRLFKPERGKGAEILSGSAQEIAVRVAGILKERGIRS